MLNFEIIQACRESCSQKGDPLPPHTGNIEGPAEAVAVAAEMGGGPVLARCGFAFKVVEYLKGRKKQA